MLPPGGFACRWKSPGGWQAMGLQRAPLWLLGAALGAFVPGGCCGSLSHSLSYFYLHLPEPSQGRPQYFIRSYLDDQPIARFDSLTRKMESLVPWMKERGKENFLAPKKVFWADLENISKRDQLAGGLHTWQAIWGCELREDRRKRGYFHYGYDGMDFISFKKETLTWVPAQPQAQKVKEMWEEDPRWSEKMKGLLEETCIAWLQRYLSYQKEEAVQRIKSPVEKVTRKVVDERLEVLTCQAFGFYPKEIQASWMRDGKDCKNETLHRNVAPNSDGTYYVWLSIEIDPKERDRFWCHLEHEGETATWWKIPVRIGAGILFLRCCWCRCRKKRHRKETTCPDQVSPERLPSPPSTQNGIQLQEMLPPTIT